MAWKGALRSVVAASRAMDHEAQRYQKQVLKEQMTADASDAVADWENYIRNLTSLHTKSAERIDWAAMTRRSQPSEPKPVSRHEMAAQAALTSYKPRFFDFLNGGGEMRKNSLQNAVVKGREADVAENEKAMRKHAAALEESRNDAALAKRILAGEASAIIEVISELKSFTDIDMIGKAIAFTVEGTVIHAMPEVHGTDIVPNMRRKQLASGKLSETKMPVSQFNELYQDYVASAALRVAGDLFRILPLDEVYVTCMALMLNTATGHQEATPILSVQFVRDTYSRLHLDGIDPSDALSNFRHTMQFKKTKGFEPVEPLLAITSSNG